MAPPTVSETGLELPLIRLRQGDRGRVVARSGLMGYEELAWSATLCEPLQEVYTVLGAGRVPYACAGHRCVTEIAARRDPGIGL